MYYTNKYTCNIKLMIYEEVCPMYESKKVHIDLGHIKSPNNTTK